MFGDFSRFENDPEIGLNGIYLSQGSPILDSDWNEQMAALTDWITVVGQLATGDVLKKAGFKVTREANGNFEVHPGMALLGGRIAQSQSLFKGVWQDNKLSCRRMYSDPDATASSFNVYLSLVSRSLPTTQVQRIRSHSTNSVAEVTDWAFHITNLAKTPENRTIGDGSFMVPRMRWKESLAKMTFPLSVTTSVIEFHVRGIDRSPQYKVAYSPNNIIELKGNPGEILKKGHKITVGHGVCSLLDLTEDKQIFAEYEDDRLAHERSFKTLWPEKVDVELRDVAKLVPVKIDKAGTSFTLTFEHDFEAGELKDALALRPCLRLWNSWGQQSNGLAGVEIIDVKDDAVETYLVAGDRWYLPVNSGQIVLDKDDRLPGHRVFRGISLLDSNTQAAAAYQAAADTLFASGIPPLSPKGIPHSSDRHIERSLHPVAHRLDDSLHRLTGALNASRALTRQTPCKELQTRVSYLPLRRWLASTFVHEIVDLELDSFLAKVQRSIDVAPEDEHRFREQAALVLEEANQLAGRIPSRAEPTNRAVDIV